MGGCFFPGWVRSQASNVGKILATVGIWCLTRMSVQPSISPGTNLHLIGGIRLMVYLALPHSLLSFSSKEITFYNIDDNTINR